MDLGLFDLTSDLPDNQDQSCQPLVVRQLLRARQACRVAVPQRGKAITNWKRPTMAEYLPPTEAYGPANAKRQSSYNMFMVGGFLAFGASLMGGTILDVWEFNPYPHHLIKQVKGTPIHDDAE